VDEGGKVHPDDWANPSDALHGEKIRAIGLSGCAECHGANFSGGTSEVACSECHSDGGAIPHPPLAEFVDPIHENYHGRIFWLNNWDFSGCQSCHGDDLAGGVVNASCSNAACHSSEQGIFACDNCHAYVGDMSFEDVTGNTSTDSVTVGAHTSHYTNPNSLTVNVDCASCHLVPDSTWAEGHLDLDLYAEVIFDTLATNDGSLTPVWYRSAATCADVYCHGAFNFDGITGNSDPWTWTETINGDLCGTCHGLPPTTGGHFASANCGLAPCHADVVSSEDHRTIIDTRKHINGAKDVSGN